MLGGGLGLKLAHAAEAAAARAEGLWFEVHAENHMVDGGPRLALLEAVRREHPLSLHGVSLSLAGAEPPDPAALARFAALVRRFEPALVSEHLAWSRFGGHAFPDLLPVPRTAEALATVVRHIGIVQEAIGRPIAIENPSHYVPLDGPDGHACDEVAFLAEVLRRSGCALLLDVNNAVVAAHNLGAAHAASPEAWVDAVLDAIPAERIVELHVAGHRVDPGVEPGVDAGVDPGVDAGVAGGVGAALLIDTHDRAVSARVWALAARVTARIGPRPVLVERDADVPPFAVLMAERTRAQAIARGGA